MNNDELRLSAVMAERDGGFEAQLLEIDIAARGATTEELLRELAHAITVTYDVAVELNQTPFIDILSVPARYHAQHRNSGAKQVGYIELRADVGVALALALHARRPGRKIAVVKRAA